MLAPILCAAAAVAADEPSAAPPSPPPSFTVTSLGLADDPSRSVRAINDAGTTAGWLLHRVDGELRRQAFVQPRGGEVRLLPQPAGARQTFATHLNDNGWVTGSAENLGPVVWTPQGQVIALRTPPPGSVGQPLGINNGNQVAITEWPGGASFLWDPRVGLRQFATGSESVTVRAIGDGGHLAGSVQYGNGMSRAFVWSAAAGMRDLPTIGGREAVALSVNDVGHAVGYDLGGDSHRPTFWSEQTGLINLGQIPGHPSNTIARGINANDWVVGDTLDWPDRLRRAFLWSPAFGMHDLDDLLDPGWADWRIIATTQVTDAGEILGLAYRGDALHYALLTPVPEPSTAITAGVSLAGAIFLRRRLRP